MQEKFKFKSSGKISAIKQTNKQKTNSEKENKKEKKKGNELASKNPPLDVAFQHHLPCKYHLRQKSLHKDRQETQIYITIFCNWLFAEEQITGDACGVTLSDLFGIHTFTHIDIQKVQFGRTKVKNDSSLYSSKRDTLHINR